VTIIGKRARRVGQVDDFLSAGWMIFSSRTVKRPVGTL
jgi:hypothetical protein